MEVGWGGMSPPGGSDQSSPVFSISDCFLWVAAGTLDFRFQ